MTVVNNHATTASRRRPLRFRGLTSFVVTLSFLIMAMSGIVLYVAPRGRDANWSGWTCLSLWREQWVAIHIVITTLFLAFGIAHLLLNWRPLYGYIYDSARRRLRLWRELLLASLIVAGLAVMALCAIWPASQLVQWSDQAKDAWSRSLPRAPFPHMELMTLSELAGRAGIPADHLLAVARQEGLAAGGPHESLLELAERHSTTPAAVFEILRTNVSELDRLRAGGRDRFRRGATDGGA